MNDSPFSLLNDSLLSCGASKTCIIWSQSVFTVFRPAIPKTRANAVFTRVVAERVGVEPTCGFTRNSISSRARYGHFDTAPRLFPPRFALQKLERKPGEKARGSNLSKTCEALNNKGLSWRMFRMEYTISSQGRYDHFDTAPGRAQYSTFALRLQGKRSKWRTALVQHAQK